jgi:uncharacterized protein (DUF486 family)
MNSTFLRTAGLLIVSNTFMTFAWYAHLRNLSDRKWYIAAVLSWGIAFFEYMFMVPAHGFRSIRGAVHAAATQARFSLGGAVHSRGCVLHVSLARNLLSDRLSNSNP